MLRTILAGHSSNLQLQNTTVPPVQNAAKSCYASPVTRVRAGATSWPAPDVPGGTTMAEPNQSKSSARPDRGHSLDMAGLVHGLRPIGDRRLLSPPTFDKIATSLRLVPDGQSSNEQFWSTRPTLTDKLVPCRNQDVIEFARLPNQPSPRSGKVQRTIYQSASMQPDRSQFVNSFASKWSLLHIENESPPKPNPHVR
jgi:hypothetical protein